MIIDQGFLPVIMLLGILQLHMSPQSSYYLTYLLILRGLKSLSSSLSDYFSLCTARPPLLALATQQKHQYFLSPLPNPYMNIIQMDQQILFKSSCIKSSL